MTVEDQKSTKGTSKMSQKTMCLVLILLLIILVLVAIVIYLAVAVHSKQNICLTASCVRAATTILDAVDFSVNPCDNFYEFACGEWIKKNIVPEDKSYYATFSKLRDEVQVKLKALLEANVTDEDIESVVKAKHLYQSCINTELIEKRNLSVVYPLLDKLDGFPMLVNSPGGGWSPKQHKLNILLAKLMEFFNDPLVGLSVYKDVKQKNRSVIYLDQSSLFLPSKEYYTSSEKNITQSLKNVLTEIVVMFGVDPLVARQDVTDVVDFEIGLAKIHSPREDRIDNEKRYNHFTLGELNSEFGKSTKHGFDLAGFIRSGFAMEGVNMTLDEDTIVIVQDLNFTSKLMPMIDNFSPRTVANYVILRFLRNRLYYLPRRFEDFTLEFKKLIGGASVLKPRWRKCTGNVQSYLGIVSGRMFIEDNFVPKARDGMSSMIKYIKESFNEHLNDLDWMDEETITVAKEKIEHMGEDIGYDPDLLDDEILNRRYENITVDPELYFENILGMLNEITVRNLGRLKHEPFFLSWEGNAADVNAYYSPSSNKIMFPAGILQQPHFDMNQPWSLNYGGIGTLVGHEITHGFDNSGRQYDKNGRLSQWWNDNAIDAFNEKTQCFKEQYGNFRVPEAGYLRMSGIITLGENIADNGGLKQSFTGYKKWLENNGGSEKQLPGVNLTNEQLFFLGYAQIRCMNIRKEDAISSILTHVHSPPRFRIIGALQNSKEFSEVYGCPAGSFMNPEKKCYVW